MDLERALTLDYESTCAFIDKCDAHMFRVKKWALITTSAVIAFSVSTGVYGIVLVNVVLIPAFLYLELIYKSFQDTAIAHTFDLSERIDRAIQSGSTVGVSARYSFGFGRKLEYPSLNRCIAILRSPTRRHIVNFYGLIVVFSFGALVLGWSIA